MEPSSSLGTDNADIVRAPDGMSDLAWLLPRLPMIHLDSFQPVATVVHPLPV
jgi:hypothetical protein